MSSQIMARNLANCSQNLQDGLCYPLKAQGCAKISLSQLLSPVDAGLGIHCNLLTIFFVALGHLSHRVHAVVFITKQLGNFLFLAILLDIFARAKLL